MKHKSEVDVAVLLLFFTRTRVTTFTFEQIRKARPARLYLYQDGPRPGRQDDIVNIKQCRDTIESMIDWDCEVHRLYQEKNYGCDPSEYLSQKWMFETETKGIIIEDDDVMSVSFFRFCKELLDRYENDTRINMICGQNHLGTYDAGGADYLFCQGGSIWGWATWKRNVDLWDPQYKYLEDEYTKSVLKAKHGSKMMKGFFKTCLWHKSTGKEYYESIRNANQFTNAQFNIVPSKNMTCNIGIDIESTHSQANPYAICRWLRSRLFAETYEIDFPINHPQFVVEDVIYQDKYRKVTRGTFIQRFFHLRRIEGVLYKIFPFFGRINSKEYTERVNKYMN